MEKNRLLGYPRVSNTIEPSLKYSFWSGDEQTSISKRYNCQLAAEAPFGRGGQIEMRARPLTPQEAAARIELILRVSELEREVRELRKELAFIKAKAKDSLDSSKEAFPPILKQLVEMTGRILPGEIRIENSMDDEYPGTGVVLFHVTLSSKLGDVNSIIDKELEWHRNARNICPSATCHFALEID